MIKEKNIRVKDVERFVYQTFGDEHITAVVTGNGNTIILTKHIANPERISIKDAFGILAGTGIDSNIERDEEDRI